MNSRIHTENLALLYKEAARRYSRLPGFAVRESALKWRPVSFEAFYEQGVNIATGLIALGVQARDHIGLFGDNRYEWIVADCAVQLCGAADVPRGRDITDEELKYIIEHAGIKITFVETSKLQERVIRLMPQLPELKQVILLDPKATPIQGVMSLHEVQTLGENLRAQGNRDAEDRTAQIKPDDLFTLIYTSGTTGTPKGVMLTHANMMSQIRNLPGQHDCTDRVLSVLPIWHIFERVIEMYTISFGGCTYYSSIFSLGEDMRNVEPTFMASAPRLWEKLHERILNGIKASHPVRQILFHIAYFLARHYNDSEYFFRDKKLKMHKIPVWKRWALMPLYALRWLIILPWYGFFNAAVLERIRQSAGGSLHVTISGGGALPIHIDRFFNNVGIPVVEGYGMTETSPVISVRSLDNLVVGTVGPPIPNTQIQIRDPETGVVLFPDLNHQHQGRARRGEIWVRGPQVMKGYYQEPELTQQALVDGWLRTGDLGIITFNDCLKILGRSKATIVLSSGENVEPEPIEMRLMQSKYIENCMLVGQDKKYLGALIVPILSEFNQSGFAEQSLEALAMNTQAHNLIRDEIRRINSNGTRSYEQIREFRLLPAAFMVGDELTNLYKIKRHIIEAKFGHIIKDIYSNGTSKNK
jgi:long-chain acyl-CoA synthetase